MIKTTELSKDFGKVHAVRNLSIHVKDGEIYGFLGLNGAGKTTTIRMLLGLIKPTVGTAWINGVRVSAGNHEMWKEVGYMVEAPHAYPELTVRENLEIIRRLRFIRDKHAVDDIMETLKLEEYGDRKVKNLSTGNAQRLGLAKALIHHPKLLLLDEPVNGLDPAGIVEIRKLLQHMAQREGITIFLSSHILSEISRIATRIGIIHYGALIQEIDAPQLDQLRQKKLVLRTGDTEKTLSILNQQHYQVQHTENGILECTDETAIAHPGDIATLLVQQGVPPTLLKVEEEDLESYFLRTIETGGTTP